jgi:hypothetical protein
MSNQEPKVHVIDGVTYVEVDRKAKEGEKVIAIKADDYEIGEVLTVTESDRWCLYAPGEAISVKEYDCGMYHDEYRVLEPRESEEVTVDSSQASEQVIEMFAALSRKIVSLERQLADTQRNLETFAEQTESNSEDIRTLDERTQPKECGINTSESVAVPKWLLLALSKNLERGERR